MTEELMWDNRQFSWQPQTDITAFELAQCLTMFSAALFEYLPGPVYDRLPLDAQRHWKVTP